MLNFDEWMKNDVNMTMVVVIRELHSIKKRVVATKLQLNYNELH